jgi:FkbM family methyltransferase
MCASLPGVSEVHAFEISPLTFVTLSQNCAAVTNVRLNPFGLGVTAGTVIIYHAPGSTDRTGLLSIDDGYARETLAAELRTGDDYMRDAALDRIAFLKIDVEGSDIDVLKGFSSALSAQRIAAVQFEHGEPNIESRTFLRDIVEFLQGLGYYIFRLYPSSLERIDRCTYAMEDFRGRNYVALLPEIAAKLGL